MPFCAVISDYWAGAQRKAQREYEAHLLAIRQARETALRVFAQVARTVVDEQIPAGLVREAVFEAIPREQVEQAHSLALTDHYLTPEGLTQVQQRASSGLPVDIDGNFYEQLLQALREEQQRKPWWKFW